MTNYVTVSGAIALLSRYESVVGLTRGFSGLPTPSSMQAKATYEADPTGWDTAVQVAKRTYAALDKSFGAAVWAVAYRLIADVHPDLVEAFFEAVTKGTDAAGSPTRQLGDWARRRPITRTRTGDTREPLEVIIRAFNAWRSSKPMAFPKAPGFVMSRVR